jgi:hypothetical protein
MTFDEHVQRLTTHRSPSDDLSAFEVSICAFHGAIAEGFRHAHGSKAEFDHLPALIERLVLFFNSLPAEVNVVEALKLVSLDSTEKAKVAKLSWFGFWATMHMYVSHAYESASWLEDPQVIMEAGPDPGDGWQGAPVSIACAIIAALAYAESKSIDVAAVWDSDLDDRLGC